VKEINKFVAAELTENTTKNIGEETQILKPKLSANM
jgi:hypothetical protein